MSNWQIIWWVIFGFLILFLVIPTFTYVITKCFYDAKNQSTINLISSAIKPILQTIKGVKNEKKDVDA